MLAGHNKKTYLIIIAAALLILIAIIIVWLYLRKPAAEPQETLPAAEEQESTYGTLPEIESPELNPAERTNPFKDVYKNPFGQ